MVIINRVIDSGGFSKYFPSEFTEEPTGTAELPSPPPGRDSCHTSAVAMLTMLQAVIFTAAHFILKPDLLLCRLN